MPEIKKYLNRDGLEEYNSLLPHSSGEMQDYVDNWLDAHPEASTTVQDGAISEPKLADKSVSLRTLADDTVHMLKGMMLTKEISGEMPTTDDAYAAPPFALTVDGKSTQVATTGKNLFNKNDHGYWDGAIGTTGHIAGPTSTDYSYFRIPVTEGDVVYASNPAGAHRLAWSNGLITINSGIAFPYTVPSGIDEVSGRFESSKFSYATVTLNNPDLTYEPYSGGIASPSPDWPQEIDSIEVESVVINAIDVNRAYIDASAEGITNIDDTYEGTITALRNALRCIYPVPAGSAITVSLKPAASLSGSLNIIGKRADTGGNVYLITAPNNTTEWRTYNAVTSYALSEIRLSHNASDSRVWQMRQLRIRADGLRAYVPYAQVSANVPTHGNVLCSLPVGIFDTLKMAYLKPSSRDGYAWYATTLQKNTGRVVLNGTETWMKDNDSDRMYTSNDTISRQLYYANRLLCTHLRAYPHYNDVGNGVTGISAWNVLAEHPNKNWFYVAIDGITTVEEITQWFADNPTEVIYQLATPVVTTLEPIELPVLPAPIFTVWSDPKTHLLLEYIRDSNIVIQRIEEAIADQ